jgi:hypothetical protein
MASSEIDATTGMRRIPIAIPAASTLNTPTSRPRSWKWGVRNVRAKNPRTTVGMPASVSRAGLMMFRTRGRAYSLM